MFSFNTLCGFLQLLSILSTLEMTKKYDEGNGIYPHLWRETNRKSTFSSDLIHLDPTADLYRPKLLQQQYNTVGGLMKLSDTLNSLVYFCFCFSFQDVKVGQL